MPFWKRKPTIEPGWQALIDTGLVTRKELEWYRDYTAPDSFFQIAMRGGKTPFGYRPTASEMETFRGIQERIQSAKQEVEFNRGLGGKVDAL